MALNRAVALTEVKGSDEALPVVVNLYLQSYHLFHSVWADLLRSPDLAGEAAQAHDAAC